MAAGIAQGGNGRLIWKESGGKEWRWERPHSIAMMDIDYQVEEAGDNGLVTNYREGGGGGI